MSISLFQALERVARRFRHERLFSSLALCWLVWALVGCGMRTSWFQESIGPIDDWWLTASLAVVALVTGVICVAWAQTRARDPRWVARRIEAKHPELKTGLLAAVEEIGASPSGQLGFLQYAVVKEVLDHRRKSDWNETVPSWTLRGAMVAHAAALCSLLVVLVTMSPLARSDVGGTRSIKSLAGGTGVSVDPGNTEIERGTSLLVVARFQDTVPAEANLVVESPAGPTAQRGMIRSLEDPTFAGRVESVETDIAYRVEYGGKSTDTFQVKVFEYPELVRTDAKLVFPGYTALQPKTVEDIRHVTAVEGTELTLLCRLNKDVATARLVDAEKKSIELKGTADGRHVYRATMTLADPRRFKVELVDKDGRTNKLASEIVVNVTRNHPPVVKTTQPAHDVRVSPVEELKLKADIEDDFGVTRHGLSYSIAGGESREIVLNSSSAGKRISAGHLLDFEALHAAPDQLVTYFFWGEDVGPDGARRRTSGDMYFAEVRHFEEIFRQGEQPPGGSAQNEEQEGGQNNARDSDQLAELQKEIINGTWKLVRRESGAKPTEKLAEDGKVLKEAQQSAIEKADELGERLQDAASKASLEQATRLMKDAEKRLTEVAENSSIPALAPALASEQAAYQALLKLRAREFQVIRNNSRRQQQGSRGSGGNRSQQQLQQLELTNEENRYEEQRSARGENLSQREREQQETRQVLSRLRELAQRQADVNERLKELQSALEAAKTEQAKQEIDRQLKRLREQQQQILRDTDELRERMEQEENRERMADSREQIEQGREHVRQASDALEQGRLGQALTEGTRAGRQLNDLREELRKKAANRFTEEATDMRNQARRLSEDQQKLSERLEANKPSEQHSLRDSGERKQVREGLEQQEKRLDQLLEQMRRTVQDAEESEPLLAKELYDTARKAGEQKIPDALKVSQQLVDLGISEDAAKASRHAGQGLEQLREGVERAARSVLGDETEALKRAQRELEDLGDQLDREIAQATGTEPANRNSGEPREKGQRPGQAGRRQDQGQRQPGEQQGGQDGRQGQPQPGEQQGEQDGQQGQPQPGEQQGRQDGQQGRGERQGQQGQQQGRGEGQGQQQQRGQQGQRGGQEQQGQQGGQNQQGQQGNQDQQGGGQAGGRGEQQGGRQQGQAQGPRRLRGGNPGDGERRQQGDNGGRDTQAGGSGGGDDRRAGTTWAGGPIRGGGFREWTDRMRDVEELLDNPEMRAEAARLRDRVRGERDEYKRHSKEPDWTKLKNLVAEPMNELRKRIAEEVRRRESPDALVPIDRDPVPPQFAEGVRRYYERLGSGK